MAKGKERMEDQRVVDREKERRGTNRERGGGGRAEQRAAYINDNLGHWTRGSVHCGGGSKVIHLKDCFCPPARSQDRNRPLSA